MNPVKSLCIKVLYPVIGTRGQGDKGTKKLCGKRLTTYKWLKEKELRASGKRFTMCVVKD